MILKTEVSLVIPAYKEPTVGNVVCAALSDLSLFKEVVVVDDGSNDDTAQKARDAGATVIVHATNMGKGFAVRTGIENTTGNIVCVVDADLINLKVTHLWELTYPVVSGECQATMAIFSGGRWLPTLAQRLMPAITGQRCLRRDLLNGYVWNSGFGIEVSLNFHLHRQGIQQTKIAWHNVSHVMKEEKRGIIRGSFDRFRMYKQVVCTYYRELLKK